MLVRSVYSVQSARTLTAVSRVDLKLARRSDGLANPLSIIIPGLETLGPSETESLLPACYDTGSSSTLMLIRRVLCMDIYL